MKRGGMYQRDARAMPGCLIVMSLILAVSVIFLAGTMFAKALEMIT